MSVYVVFKSIFMFKISVSVYVVFLVVLMCVVTQLFLISLCIFVSCLKLLRSILVCNTLNIKMIINALDVLNKKISLFYKLILCQMFSIISISNNSKPKNVF